MKKILILTMLLAAISCSQTAVKKIDVVPYPNNVEIKNGFFNENGIDTIFIFGGTNDSWIDSPIGNIKYDQITEDDIKMILPAFSALISKLKSASPNSKIIPLINCGLKPEVADGFEEICIH